MAMQNEQVLKNDPGYGFNDFRIKDSMNSDFAPLAQLAVPVDRVPEDIQKRMIKVLSKHRVSEVREWCQKLMQSYQLLHAVEKPMNLDYVKPFSNTSDLKNMTPKIHFDLAQKRQEQENEKSQKEFKMGFGSNSQTEKQDNIEIDME